MRRTSGIMRDMHRVQRYVSDELSHFVGRSLTTLDEKYSLLIRILTTQALIPPALLPTGGVAPGPARVVAVRYKERISGNNKYLPSVLCFCDIPTDDLPLHIAKYSPFGLSFSKRFLISRGANPVFYVVSQSPSTSSDDHGNPLSRANLFDDAEPAIRSLVDQMARGGPQRTGWPHSEVLEAIDRAVIARVQNFISWELFSFFKFVDAELSDEHEANYYMEREWRLVGRLSFDLEDVERVFIPREYASRFRADLPHFAGQITYSA